MSDTPRTDAAVVDWTATDEPCVYADFARQLERDLSRVIGQFNAAVLELARRPEARSTDAVSAITALLRDAEAAVKHPGEYAQGYCKALEDALDVVMRTTMNNGGQS